jgi:hypothetical protein
MLKKFAFFLSLTCTVGALASIPGNQASIKDVTAVALSSSTTREADAQTLQSLYWNYE